MSPDGVSSDPSAQSSTPSLTSLNRTVEPSSQVYEEVSLLSRSYIGSSSPPKQSSSPSLM